SEHRQAIKPLVRIAEQDFDISPFGISAFVEAAPQSGHVRRIAVRSSGAEIANHWDCRLLRPGRERPKGARSRRAAEPRDELPPRPRDELPPSHSITSSARRRNDSRIVSPMAFAVLRLMTSSSFTGT